MALEQKIDISKILDYFTGVTDVCINVPAVFDQIDGETVVELLEKAWNMGEKTWMLQAELLRLINDRSKYGDKAVENVAKQIGITRSYAFDLYKIAKNLLSQDEGLKNLPNLSVSHYITVIRNLKKVKDPIDILKLASDEGWSTKDLKKAIDGEKVEREYSINYFSMAEADVRDKEWAMYERISEKAYICKDRLGNMFLELKTFKS